MTADNENLQESEVQKFMSKDSQPKKYCQQRDISSEKVMLKSKKATKV